MTERPKRLHYKKRTSVLCFNRKRTLRALKHHLETSGGLVPDIVRRLNTNKTQILHRIRLKKFVPNTPLEDKYSIEKLQPDDEIIIPQDDLYTISWEADFDYQDFELRQDDIPNEELQQADTNGSGSNDDYVIYDNANDDAVRPRTATSRVGILT